MYINFQTLFKTTLLLTAFALILSVITYFNIHTVTIKAHGLPVNMRKPVKMVLTYIVKSKLFITHI